MLSPPATSARLGMLTIYTSMWHHDSPGGLRTSRRESYLKHQQPIPGGHDLDPGDEAGGPMKNMKAAVLVCSALTLASTSAMAAWHSGRIITHHLNANAGLQARGVCFETSPALPGRWVCLYKNSNLYTEMTNMLRDAYIHGKTCQIEYNDSGALLLLDCQ
jgi:hypothetical protein